MTPTETVWIAQEAVAYAEGPSRACAPVAVDGPKLPAGLRGRATPARDECGPDWMFVRFDAPGYPDARLHNYYVRTADLVRQPPKTAWDRAKPTGTAFVRQAGDKPTVGVPVDDPAWTSPAYLVEGETVEVLPDGVVRASTGRELWLDPFYLSPTDPLLGPGSTSDTAAAPLRRRFAAGRPLREKVAPLATIPAADALAKAPKGQPFVLTLRPEWLSEPRFSPDWFDPVGQRLDHACDADPRPFEPCGRYELDYAALGAWWPERATEVVAIWDGARLQVVALEPFAASIAVTPGWDGATPAPSP